MSWQDCVVDNDYEIFTEYPYLIKKKSNGHEVSEWINDGGYPCCSLNRKKYRKHRIVALQFILNPNNLPEVDHINHNRNDYHVFNLRWVSSSENKKNRSSTNDYVYEFVDEISNDAIMVIDYGKNSFEHLYYDENDDSFYLDIGVNFRKLHTNFDRDGYAFVYAKNTNNKTIRIYINKFKHLYGLI